MFALLNTSSRGGNLAFIITLLLTLFSLKLQNKTKYDVLKRNLRFIFIMSFVLLIILMLTGVSSNLIDRYWIDGFQFHGREYSNQTSWAMFKDNYIFGTGIGTYPFVSPIYKVFEYGVSVRSLDAHALNDYMEFLAEQGVLGFTIFGTSILYLLNNLFNGLKKTKRSIWGLQIATFYSCVGILVHSIFDFNFQLPVNTIFFFIVLALGLKLNVIRNSNCRVKYKHE
jgi:O-antigen ligase